MATRRAPDLHQSGCCTIDIGPSSQRKLNQTAWRIRGRLHDRSPIELRSRRDHGSSVVESRPRGTAQESNEISPLFEAKLKRSRSIFEGKLKVIVARSWCFWKQSCSRFVVKLKPQRRARESLPRLRKSTPTTALIANNFGPIFLLKTHVFPPLFFNF